MVTLIAIFIYNYRCIDSILEKARSSCEESLLQAGMMAKLAWADMSDASQLAYKFCTTVLDENLNLIPDAQKTAFKCESGHLGAARIPNVCLASKNTCPPLPCIQFDGPFAKIKVVL